MPVKRDQSLSTTDAQGAAKRSKVEGAKDSNAMSTFSHLHTKNAALKGRKRFLADLEDMSHASAAGFVVNTLKAADLRQGDDEGNVVVNVVQAGTTLLGITLLVSDTSEYPEEHTFFAFSSGPKADVSILEVIDEIPEFGSSTIFQTVARVLRSTASKLKLEDDGNVTDDSAELVDEGTDDEDALMYSDDEVPGLPARASTSSLNLSSIQSDFLEIVACSPQYRPGFIRFGNDSFALTVSTPVVDIPVPANVLQAWDRNLLATTRHFTLLLTGFQNVYPCLNTDGDLTPEAVRRSASLVFHVGLTARRKPSKAHAQNVARAYMLVAEEEEEEALDPAMMDDDFYMDYASAPPPKVEEPEDRGVFERFALSHSLESLLNHNFINILRLRLRFKIAWAGAEMMQAIIDRHQTRAEDVYNSHEKEIRAADRKERKLADSYSLPPDPLVELEMHDHINVPLVAFAYTLRRFMLCSKFCTVCHDKVNLEYEVLKPYVCNRKLCQYQFYDLSMGSALEHDVVARSEVVDVLLATTYASAGEGVLDPRPIGLGLRVHIPQYGILAQARGMAMGPGGTPVQVDDLPDPPLGQDGMADFDQLSPAKQNAAVKNLLDQVPSLSDMRAAIDKKRRAGKHRVKLVNLFPAVPPAAWTLVRWCINSCIAHLEPLNDADEMIQNVDSSWKQYRLSMGAPEAEARFDAAMVRAKAFDENAKKFPTLYAFHGSPLRNWHSVIRNGLWFKEVTHGRAYGHGVYFALQGETSMGSYASGGRMLWPNSNVGPSSAVAVAEIINAPHKFVSRSPYLVVAQTEWIVCRYLLVKSSADTRSADPSGGEIPFVKLDPQFPVTLAGKPLNIPEPTYKLDVLLKARRAEAAGLLDEHDEDDAGVFAHGITPPAREREGTRAKPVVVSDDEDDDPDDYDESWADDDAGPVPGPSAPRMRAAAPARRPPVDDWKHDADWVQQAVEHLIMPPQQSSPMATKAIQRELKAMLDEQGKAHSLKELGWYLPPSIIENQENLFQWIVELHSFEDTLPIAQDMKAHGVNSLIFEIRFPATFPHEPPFFRIIRPRFLPFIQGGGGHVTGGGSMCMDLLTADGWLPSYSISAVLLQIRLAISNLDPRPARLAQTWQLPYTPTEALQGFQRAAAAHNWKVPASLTKIIR